MFKTAISNPGTWTGKAALWVALELLPEPLLLPDEAVPDAPPAELMALLQLELRDDGVTT